MWLLFAQVFTVIGLAALMMFWLMPMPVFDRNGTTVMCASEATRLATAKALTTAIGAPAVVLDTVNVERFLFNDGTSVDSLVQSPRFTSLYEITALKSIVLSLWSLQSPLRVASTIVASLEESGHTTQIVEQPDLAFPAGATVLVLSNAFRSSNESGFALIIRKHALRVGGQRPRRFTGWPTESSDAGRLL